MRDDQHWHGSTALPCSSAGAKDITSLSSVIDLVSDHHDDLVREHTSGLNRLHRLLRELIPGGAPIGASSRPATAADTVRKHLVRDLTNDCAPWSLGSRL